MTRAELKLSVPKVRNRLPRPLTEQELVKATRLADVLIHGDAQIGAPSSFDEFAKCLEVALTARSDAFDLFIELVASAPESELGVWVRQCHADSAEVFQVLSTVLAGAYLLIPGVRANIGYPGQHREPAGIEEAVDQLSDGILDPVIERGRFYVPAPPRE